jgi:hypothetical protein
MKRTQFLIVLALFAAAASFVQCGSDSSAPPDPKDEQLKKLSKNWKLTSVTKDSNPEAGYDNFELTMSGTAGQPTFAYTTAGRPSGTVTPWDASGNLTFGTDFATLLTRNDGVQITYSVSDTQLQMTFNYTGSGFTGRTSVVQGNWTFNFGL